VATNIFVVHTITVCCGFALAIANKKKIEFAVSSPVGLPVFV
jgi:hypothetical protein